MSRNLIAILRGIQPYEIMPIAEALLDAGISMIEVPLNSPDPFESIKRLCDGLKGQGTFGAGTVLSPKDVETLAAIGADMTVSPNCDPAVIAATKSAGMLSYPGVMTPSEACVALKAGADGLKIFPGEIIGPSGLAALRSVLPTDVTCLAVGGVTPETFQAWRAGGADGFGLGSALYRPGDPAAMVAERASAIVTAYDEIML